MYTLAIGFPLTSTLADVSRKYSQIDTMSMISLPSGNWEIMTFKYTTNSFYPELKFMP